MNLNLNKVILLGRIASEIIHNKLDKDNVAVFFVATNRKWKDRSGIRKEQATFHKVVCFGAIADTINKLGTKGEVVLVEGRIQHKDFPDENNRIMKKDIMIVCEKFQLGSENFKNNVNKEEEKEVEIDWSEFDL